MSSATGPTSDLRPGPADARRRRMPTQARSRERVARILDAAAALVADPAIGVDGLSTRTIAATAELPVASLYQYFADKEAVLLALCERDMAEMDEQVARDLAAVAPEDLDLTGLVEVSMRAFVAVYLRRPAFIQIWMRGRANAAIEEYGRHHNRRIATQLHTIARDAGLLDTDRYDAAQTTAVAELAVEVGDRAFQLAFARHDQGDPFLLEEAIALVTGYLRRIERQPDSQPDSQLDNQPDSQPDSQPRPEGDR